MTLPRFEYVKTQTIEEAADFAAKMGGRCMVMAGGTDIIPLLKDRVKLPEYIIDLKGIPGLKQLEYSEDGGLKVGALTTLREIETSALVKSKIPAVAAAAHYVASTQIRGRGTMAGNICNASPSADTASILLAMDATVKTVRAGGEGRVIPIDEFFKGVKKTTLDEGEIVTEITIPPLKAGEGSAYFKYAVRKAMDLAIIGVAAWVKTDGRKIADCRIAVGGANTTPFRAVAAEKQLIGQEFSEGLLEEVAVTAAGECRAISDVRASAEYRVDMVRVFTKRAVKGALGSLRAAGEGA
ncbi:MAG: xanthine dehydrogenase family protein subunit M [Clostridiales Family XIII bacterium]|jgi:carbon-monoxide dehydrogenase medium subunit|nr:xanthine dehydrogenase family protein subunit M [Clostridiales Family XIII bacterium]